MENVIIKKNMEIDPDSEIIYSSSVAVGFPYNILSFFFIKKDCQNLFWVKMIMIMYIKT